MAKQVLIGRQIAEALAAAHDVGMVHRDIKPANIWLETRPDGEIRVKILDFGLVRSVTDSQLTATGGTLGTPAYMAPEQAGAVELDHRADLWSLGVVLYRMATTKLPFKGENALDMLINVRTGTHRPVGERNPKLPARYAELIERLLRKKREDRPQNALEVARELKIIERGLTIPINDPTELIVDVPPPPKSNRRSVLIAGLVAGIVTLSAIAYSLSGRSVTPTSSIEPTVVERKAKPPLLTGSLSNADVLRLRKAWAEFDGVPLERTDDLGGGISLDMVYIPPGTFHMGASEAEIDATLKQYPNFEREWFRDEKQHSVTISKGFYLGKYEVTQEQYERLMKMNPSHFSATGDGNDRVEGRKTNRFPVEQVSWDDARTFIQKLNDLPSKHSYRLPREAEWEYASRAGAFGPDSPGFHFAAPQDSLTADEANISATRKTLRRTEAVGSYKPNRFGLFDMHGNVFEWCEDFHHDDYYGRSPAVDPTGPSESVCRVLRGGSWNFPSRFCRSSYRQGVVPNEQNLNNGFRVAAEDDKVTKD